VLHLRRTLLSRIKPVAAGVVAACVAACATSSPQAGLATDASKAVVTESELEARVQNLAYQMNVEVTDMAYVGYAELPDIEQRQAALVMAIRVGEESSRALFYGDPTASLVELWALMSQLIQYYSTGEGRDTFGVYQDEVVARFQLLESRVARLADTLDASTREQLQREVDEWVQANPITGWNLTRESTAPLFADLKRPGGRSIWQATETMQEGMSELGDRLEIMQTELPSRITFTSALILEQKLHDLDVEARLDRMDDALAHIGEIPPTLTAERAAIVRTIEDERALVLQAVSAEREAALAAVEAMREATFEQIEAMRGATFEQIEAMRLDTVRDVDGQRVETLASLNEMVDRILANVDSETDTTVDQIDVVLADTVRAGIDHLFWTLVKLGAGFFVGVLVLLIIARVMWRPSSG